MKSFLQSWGGQIPPPPHSLSLSVSDLFSHSWPSEEGHEFDIFIDGEKREGWKERSRNRGIKERDRQEQRRSRRQRRQMSHKEFNPAKLLQSCKFYSLTRTHRYSLVSTPQISTFMNCYDIWLKLLISGLIVYSQYDTFCIWMLLLYMSDKLVIYYYIKLHIRYF